MLPSGTEYPGAIDTVAGGYGAVYSGNTTTYTYANNQTSALLALETALGKTPTAGTPYTSVGAAISGLNSIATSAAVCGGRLTLLSGTPVANVTESSNIYYTPYNGNQIALYDGVSTWNIITFSQVTITLSGLTSGTVYDLFAYNNAGSLAFDAPLAWSSTSLRATSISLLNGVYVKATDSTRRYIGTFYATSTTHTSDYGTPDGIVWGRYLFNANNRVSKYIQGTSNSGTMQTTSTSIVLPDATNLSAPMVIGISGDQVVRATWQATAEVSSDYGFIGVVTGTGGPYLVGTDRVVELTTAHTEAGEMADSTMLGLQTLYIGYNSGGATLTLNTSYNTLVALQAYLNC